MAWKKPKWVSSVQKATQSAANTVAAPVKQTVQAVAKALPPPPPIAKPAIVQNIQNAAQKAANTVAAPVSQIAKALTPPAKVNPVAQFSAPPIVQTIKNAANKIGDAVAFVPNAVQKGVEAAGDAIAKTTGLDKSPVTIKPLVQAVTKAPRQLVEGVGDVIAAPVDGNGGKGLAKIATALSSPVTGAFKSVKDTAMQTGDVISKALGTDQGPAPVPLPMKSKSPAEAAKEKVPSQPAKAQPIKPEDAFNPAQADNWTKFNKATQAYKDAEAGKISWEEYEAMIQQMQQK